MPCCDGDKTPKPIDPTVQPVVPKVPEAKVLLVGASGVGKTCLINQYTKGTFDDHQDASTGAMNTSKIFEVNDKKLKLDIWDTAGQEVYKAQTSQFYRDARVVIIVYSIVSEYTFNEIDEYKDIIKNKAPSDCLIIICGNKTDREVDRQVQYADLEEKAENLGNIKFFETTAKQNSTVKVMFDWAAKEMLKQSNGNIPRAKSLRL